MKDSTYTKIIWLCAGCGFFGAWMEAHQHHGGLVLAIVASVIATTAYFKSLWNRRADNGDAGHV